METVLAPPDVTLSAHGSIWLVQPVTPAACTWTATHLDDDAPMFGTAFAVEARFVDAIVQGMQDAGLIVRMDWED